jgi:hypothetical protein
VYSNGEGRGGDASSQESAAAAAWFTIFELRNVFTVIGRCVEGVNGRGDDDDGDGEEEEEDGDDDDDEYDDDGDGGDDDDDEEEDEDGCGSESVNHDASMFSR